MKRIYFYATAAILAISVSSCQKQCLPSEESGECSGNDRISFYVQPDGLYFNDGLKTKTSEVKSLETFYVTATTGDYGSETSAWGPVSFAKKTGYSSVYVADRYWPVTDPGYHFYASNAEISFNSSCTVAGDSDKDIVCAYLGNPVHKAQNHLTFSHIFSRIGKVTINTQEGYTISDVGISISCPVSGTYDINLGDGKTDGTGWTPGISETLTILNDVNDIYVVPGDYTLAVAYTLTKGSWQQTFNKTAAVTLEKGKICVMEGTATGGEASEIELTVTLEDWKTKDVEVVWDN